MLLNSTDDESQKPICTLQLGWCTWPYMCTSIKHSAYEKTAHKSTRRYWFTMAGLASHYKSISFSWFSGFRFTSPVKITSRTYIHLTSSSKTDLQITSSIHISQYVISSVTLFGSRLLTKLSYFAKGKRERKKLSRLHVRQTIERFGICVIRFFKANFMFLI